MSSQTRITDVISEFNHQSPLIPSHLSPLSRGSLSSPSRVGVQILGLHYCHRCKTRQRQYDVDSTHRERMQQCTQTCIVRHFVSSCHERRLFVTRRAFCTNNSTVKAMSSTVIRLAITCHISVTQEVP